MAVNNRSPLTAAGLLGPALAVTVIFLVIPLILLTGLSLYKGTPLDNDFEGITLGHYAAVLTDGFYMGTLWNTVKIAAGTTALALVFAFPTAQFLARSRSRFKSLFWLAIILPLFVGNAVRALGWMLAFSKGGVVDSLASQVGVHSADHLMYSTAAVLVGGTAVNLPYVILTLQSVIEQIDPSIEEASRSLGAAPFRTWWLVTLPLMAPGLLAASTLSFILAMNAYATPVLLGGPRFRMMAPAIADEIIVENNWPVGAVLAVVLIVVTLALTALLNGVVQRRVRRLAAA
ncbi:ABC transporter permease [Phenylobacterium sp.]|uniref:ABC transporter permease n=1 Tax=Phenylobacterium sp. TaxID=1871053 RepID=UPI0011FB58C3|nr:ABC transporter permease [Phenylobacterium sp.]THD64467.1 MAG: ABC transporter permease [Phenylobacterium sp.]